MGKKRYKDWRNEEKLKRVGEIEWRLDIKKNMKRGENECHERYVNEKAEAGMELLLRYSMVTISMGFPSERERVVQPSRAAQGHGLGR